MVLLSAKAESVLPSGGKLSTLSLSYPRDTDSGGVKVSLADEVKIVLVKITRVYLCGLAGEAAWACVSPASLFRFLIVLSV